MRISDWSSDVCSSDLVYNPASKTRTWQVGEMKKLLLEHRDAGTPVVIGRDVAGPNETVRVVALGDLDPGEVDMRCLLIIRSEEHTSELQSLMRISYAVFCLKKKTTQY